MTGGRQGSAARQAPAAGTLREGSLTRRPFAQLLVQAWREQWTGTLVIEPCASDEDDDRVLLHGGVPIAVRSSRRAPDVPSALLLLFPRHERYRFHLENDLVSWQPGVRRGAVDPFTVVARAVRNATRDDAVAFLLQRVGELTPLRLVARGELERMQLQPYEGALVWELEQRDLSTAQLRRCASAPRVVVDRFIYLLVLTRVLRLVRNARSPVPPQAPQQPRLRVVTRPPATPPSAGRS